MTRCGRSRCSRGGRRLRGTSAVDAIFQHETLAAAGRLRPRESPSGAGSQLVSVASTSRPILGRGHDARGQPMTKIIADAHDTPHAADPGERNAEVACCRENTSEPDRSVPGARTEPAARPARRARADAASSRPASEHRAVVAASIPGCSSSSPFRRDERRFDRRRSSDRIEREQLRFRAGAGQAVDQITDADRASHAIKPHSAVRTIPRTDLDIRAPALRT